MKVDSAVIADRFKGTLVELLGIRFVEAAPERVVAELAYREALTTVGGSFHGGTLMAFADTVGAAATVLNLPPGASTTTLESKTNFFAAARGGTVRAEATPLHRGKRTHVWQTRVTDESGRLLSLTIQTQMVLPAAS
jgi:1,4-dihydroxy-2-naphthoyl-CoA hydrolase